MHIGTEIKKKRKELGLTQAQLAEGITTQTMISKIERGDINPSSQSIKKIAYRLHTSVGYFYGEEVKNSESNSQTQFINYVRRLLHHQDYETLNILLDSNTNLVDESKDKYLLYFFTWANTVVQEKLNGNTMKAIETLANIIENVNDEELLFDIYVSLGSFYTKLDNYSKAEENFSMGIKLYTNKLGYNKKVKLLYNYSRTLIKLNHMNDAIHLVYEAIDLVLKNDSIYFLGSLLTLKAYILSQLENYDKAIQVYEEAIVILRLSGEEKLEVLAQRNMKSVKEKRDQIEKSNNN